MNNNTGFWVSLVLVALIAGGVSWFGAKAYYTSSKPISDTASAIITPSTTVIVSPPTQYVAWYPETPVRDTAWLKPDAPQPAYPALDTTIMLAVEVRPDSLPPDTITAVAHTTLVYNADLALFRFTQTIDPLHIRIPIRVEKSVEYLTREPLLWWEPSVSIGDYSKGVGVRVGLMKYSVGYTRVWNLYVPNDNEGIWQFSVRFGI